jgi:hypothetical protein
MSCADAWCRPLPLQPQRDRCWACTTAPSRFRARIAADRISVSSSLSLLDRVIVVYNPEDRRPRVWLSRLRDELLDPGTAGNTWPGQRPQRADRDRMATRHRPRSHDRATATTTDAAADHRPAGPIHSKRKRAAPRRPWRYGELLRWTRFQPSSRSSKRVRVEAS